MSFQFINRNLEDFSQPTTLSYTVTIYTDQEVIGVEVAGYSCIPGGGHCYVDIESIGNTLGWHQTDFFVLYESKFGDDGGDNDEKG